MAPPHRGVLLCKQSKEPITPIFRITFMALTIPGSRLVSADFRQQRRNQSIIVCSNYHHIMKHSPFSLEKPSNARCGEYLHLETAAESHAPSLS